MAEILSPSRRQRIPVASPTSPFFLGSNDDTRERAQAREARAAAIRRKVVHVPPANQVDSPCLGKDQILELLDNCIKLASENKINQKNTWELNLIDHLGEIIKVEEENSVETNFQKASCTLEAGVKIYSARVDSLHSEAYKVLGGINRAGQEDEDTIMEDASVQTGNEEGKSKKDLEKKLSPLSTLESSFEALNLKKFDVAFAVDPLYHQTSAQFDEGGAKGLLLNNLGVYAGCRVLFDSQEVPMKDTLCANQHYESDTIDLSFIREYVEQMVLNIQVKNEISPTLKIIINEFDEDNRRPVDAFGSSQKVIDEVEALKNNEVEFDGNAYEDYGTSAFDHDDQISGFVHEDHSSIVDENINGVDQTFPGYDENCFLQETEPFSSHDLNMDDRFEKVDECLFLSLGFSSKQNAWAGPDHWKYRKVKDPVADDPAQENASLVTNKKKRSKKQAEPDIDFTRALDEELPDIFAPPKNPKSLLMPASRTPRNTMLPEDCHYQPEDLVKLFLLPSVMCLGKRRRRKSSVESRLESDDCEPVPSWGDDTFGCQFDDGNDQSDVEDYNTLVPQPRQIQKIEVEYDKTSKQVDVQTLKETIWAQIQESAQMGVEGQEEEPQSFRNLLAKFPTDCRAAATVKDISPHLCFICLLHLANEHGLSIHGCTSLDDLRIRLPANGMLATNY
ncbi:condensin complex subunit 2-like isoform X2 [Mangifera indica]|uniref:condensin complex subunit 2-like isoform X2 n=1 Tax=Mangifera indica TaxID=29780 RepID=UPI001CF9671A|nr:condensin complex subunit 2-like isoform X2 [Mangifera indica]